MSLGNPQTVNHFPANTLLESSSIYFRHSGPDLSGSRFYRGLSGISYLYREGHVAQCKCDVKNIEERLLVLPKINSK